MRSRPLSLGGPGRWGGYEGHKDFTTEFDVRVDRVWTSTAEGMSDFHFLLADVSRLDNGQQLLFKCGWWTGENQYEQKCYELEQGSTYRVRAGHGYGYVYVRQPINGTMTWLETTCDLSGSAFCLP